MDINDSGHRPHATHFGELPINQMEQAPYSLRVALDTWGPQHNLFPAIYDMLQANWGDAPSRTVHRDFHLESDRDEDPYGWNFLTDIEQAYVKKAFAGGTLPQVLEMITFSFSIDGVTRAFTHQNVRTRIGAAFMQHGGRDNDWRHRSWTMPETIRRAAMRPEDLAQTGFTSCITSWTPIHRYLESVGETSLVDAIAKNLAGNKALYAALVDAGIPFQDARRVLPIGTQTYIHDIYSYPALKGVLANRLEHIMDWEFNCVAQLMLREVYRHCPAVIAESLMSHSDRKGAASFSGLESWPADGKYSVPRKCRHCGHAKENHEVVKTPRGVMVAVCEACARDGGGCRGYEPEEPETFHRAEQNPFFILDEASLKRGAPIRWHSTNGVYPENLRPRPAAR